MIIFLRSKRSVITPAGRVNINQGNRLATATVAIKSGDLVTAEANQGYATWETPSPKLLTPWANQSRQ